MTLKKDVQRVVIKEHEGQKRPYSHPRASLSRTLSLGLPFLGDVITANIVITTNGRERFVFTRCSVYLIPAIKFARIKLAFTYP